MVHFRVPVLNSEKFFSSFSFALWRLRPNKPCWKALFNIHICAYRFFSQFLRKGFSCSSKNVFAPRENERLPKLAIMNGNKCIIQTKKKLYCDSTDNHFFYSSFVHFPPFEKKNRMKRAEPKIVYWIRALYIGIGNKYVDMLLLRSELKRKTYAFSDISSRAGANKKTLHFSECTFRISISDAFFLLVFVWRL